MRFTITHNISYRYSEPVFLEPQVMRFRPRFDGSQTVERFQITVKPKPIGMSVDLDVEGNTVHHVWFEEAHQSLSVTAESTVATSRFNPFDYLLMVSRLAVPMTYADDLSVLLRPALNHRTEHAMVTSLVYDILAAKPVHIVHFLDLLNQKIYDTCDVVHRKTGQPWPPAKTLLEKRGACRDLTVLFMEACRTVGLASRFVSGYRKRPGEPDHELHAWAEVYLPGAGWRGYDPTEAMAVADHHVAVAASVVSENTTPVQGTFRGDGQSSFESEITITEAE